MGKKARLQKHHITYRPEWVVELKQSWHRVISRIQITRATPEQYRLLVNFHHAIAHELNRMRRELDTGGEDLRDYPPKRERIGKGEGDESAS